MVAPLNFSDVNQDALARLQATYVINHAAKIGQSVSFTLSSSTSTSLLTILTEAVDARAAAVLIVNNSNLALHIKQDGTDATTSNANLGGNGSIQLEGTSDEFDDIRLLSPGAAKISVLVFVRPVQV